MPFQTPPPISLGVVPGEQGPKETRHSVIHNPKHAVDPANSLAYTFRIVAAQHPVGERNNVQLPGSDRGERVFPASIPSPCRQL